MEKVIVVLSGGLDSTTCMAIARAAGKEIYPLTFAYGQKHTVELEAARQVASYYGVSGRHKIINLEGLLSGSALTDADKEIPTGRSISEIGRVIPSTYVPARNIVFLALALAQAEPLDARAIYLGVNALDFSGYPDCRPEFISAFQEVINKGTAAGVEGHGIRIETPLIHLTKAEIIKTGIKLGAPYHLSYSCYQGSVPSCGTCDACLLRLKGFQEAGVTDPIPYRNKG
ncbi:Queuosine biosynthesis protein QueC [Moorella glycerini]|uniref:7-cyano-7-deazaguanine synthase n=1 Tax=Neomoorella stamsii TaxID=1266720 RepID=A0A9X7P6A4_9FIRM|nr:MULTISPECIES: 7-cyano-7-deazaguanine synthase QueC [Moorella]PRR72798.1 7-cyano-7-deazaguanine synthase [Moorella stamsii]CEP66265.1 Queuosine biosynthesis protein QueC [Moorella glycerini]CEP68143.1 Queuosine biosynthesis protein QueC [Moorella glycerini]